MTHPLLQVPGHGIGIGIGVWAVADELDDLGAGKRPARDRQHGREPPGTGRQLVPRGEHRVLEPRRSPGRERPGVGVESGDEQPRQVGHAVRPPEHLVDERLVRTPPQHLRDQLTRGVAVERGHVELLEPGETTDVAQPGVQRVSDPHLLAPQGQHHGHRPDPGAGDDVAEHVEALVVHPLQVVDDEDDRPFAGHPVQPRVELDGVDPDRPGTPTRCLRDRRDAARHVAQHPADGAERRGEGGHRQATAPQDQRPVGRRLVQDAPDEAGLADPRGTGDEQCRRLPSPRPVDDLTNARLLGIPPDEGCRPVPGATNHRVESVAEVGRRP